MKKVSFLWRMVTIYLLGVIAGAFLTLTVIASKINNGDTINIGKIKIKNAHDIELPIIIKPDNSDNNYELNKKDLRKLKRAKRKEK